jgi:hypothetical protein
LEQELTAVAVDAFPETPDVAGAVRARLEHGPKPSRRTRRRPGLVLVVAALVAAALSAALAVPQARSTILHWFGIGGVRIEFVEQLPPVTEDRAPSIGVAVSLAEARTRVGFRVLVPGGDVGPPDAVYVGHFTVDEVTLLYGRPRQIRLLLTEIAGRLNLQFAAKFIQGDAHVRLLSVAGRPALWIEGAPHEFVFVTPTGQVASAPLRLDKNTLLWQQDGLLLRLEGDLDLAQALRIARSLR